MAFVGSSLWELRKKIGSDPVVWPGVTLLVKNAEGKILMEHRKDDGNWGILGGFFELDDNAEQCARRELFEETGMEAEKVTMFGVLTDAKITRYKYPNGHEVQSPSYFFVVEVGDQKPRIEEAENYALQWCDFDEVFARKTGRIGYTVSCMNAYKRWLDTKEFQIL